MDIRSIHTLQADEMPLETVVPYREELEISELRFDYVSLKSFASFFDIFRLPNLRKFKYGSLTTDESKEDLIKWIEVLYHTCVTHPTLFSQITHLSLTLSHTFSMEAGLLLRKAASSLLNIKMLRLQATKVLHAISLLGWTQFSPGRGQLSGETTFPQIETLIITCYDFFTNPDFEMDLQSLRERLEFIATERWELGFPLRKIKVENQESNAVLEIQPGLFHDTTPLLSSSYQIRH